MKPVEVTYGQLVLPAYPVGPADPEPPLLEEFAPRGQPIYPYPTIERYVTTPTSRSLKTVVLENEWLRLTFLPELNARLYSCWDKLAAVEVLYANPELKPGLVGLRGAWYATGIEVNFPCSHTVTTIDEVAWEVLVDDDGAVSFVAWDVEAVSGMSWECRTTLRPGEARFTMQTRLANTTDLPHRWYFWVNAAFPILEGSRFVLPPSTRRIFVEGAGHPGEAGYIDYPVHDGVDISLLANLKRHSALFAVAPDDGFFGLHHAGRDTGVAHVADPSLVHGRKIWSWGQAPDGAVWHDVLTDSGGPYCEVQSGPLQHQLEYRTLGPGQQIVQEDCWLPTRGLGGLGYATDLVAAAWEPAGNGLAVRLLAARQAPAAVMRIETGGIVVAEATADLSPSPVAIELPRGERLVVRDPTGRRWAELPLVATPGRTPPTLRAARPATPGQVGRYYEWQGARRRAAEAYLQGAEEEPLAAAALARFALERADAEAAARWAGRAMALDWHCPEAVLTAALAAREERRFADARWWFERLLGYPGARAWGLLGLIDESLATGRWEQAVTRCRTLLAEGGDARVHGRLAHALRRLGGAHPQAQVEPATVRVDPLLWAERRLVDRSTPPLSATAKLAAVALLVRFGDRTAALALLDDACGPAPGTPPGLLAYARAWVAEDDPGEVEWGEGFAHRAEAIRILRYAVHHSDYDPQAHYHLACALAAGGDWESAAVHWAVASVGPCAAAANRNLGLTAWRIRGDREAAASFYRHAMAAGGGPRTLLEQDLLLAELGRHETRVAALEVADRSGDTRIPLRLAAALLDAGCPREALACLESTHFQLFEGGWLPQHLWRACHVALAREALAADPRAAAEHYRAATDYPAHLGVGEPAANQCCELWLRCGDALARAGDQIGAQAAWRRGAEPGDRLRLDVVPFANLAPEVGPPGLSAQAVRNEACRALCLRRIGREDEAVAVLDGLDALAAERAAPPRIHELLAAARDGRAPD